MQSLRPIPLHSQLAPTPKQSPKYATTVKNNQGQPIVLADPRASRALVALMNQHAVAGGAACHWGGPSAFAEIISAVHGLMFAHQQWFEKFNFINDAGHTENGIYAIRALYQHDDLNFEDLKKFRSIESKLTGHGEAHLNPQGVLISNGPLGSGVAQAQGLCLADKMSGNNRVTLLAISDGGSMEGEAREAFASIPGLASKGKMNPFIMLISDNNTKLSGRIDSDSFSMRPTFESLETLGFELQKVEDGHDLQTVYCVIENAIAKAEKNPNKPIALWFKTIKGKGVQSTEKSSSGGHGHPLKAYDPTILSFLNEIYQNNVPDEFVSWAKSISTAPEKKDSENKGTSVAKEKVQKGVAKALIECAKNGLPLISVTSDLPSSTGVKDFQAAYPQQTIDVGVAEANMVSVAVGLSRHGYIPVVDTFAQFGITKGNLPLIMAGLSQGPVIAFFSHTGFQDAADGASHQATTYFAATAAIPHTQVISLSCSEEAYILVKMAIEDFASKRKQNKVPESYLFFLGREDFPAHFSATSMGTRTWGAPEILTKGNELLLVATGPTVPLALRAEEFLRKQGHQVTVINNAFINHPDLNKFSTLLKENKNKLLTVEDHQEIGGMGQTLLSKLISQGDIIAKAKIMGINGQFGQSAYKAEQLYQKHGIGVEQIVQNAQKLLLA